MTSPPKVKRKGRTPKGSPFEREFCVRLSEWITCGVSDEAFWRSQASGGRQTTRAKSGRTTRGQAGDIAATDPAFVSVTERVVWELKRGYPDLCLQRLMETSKLEGANTLEKFITKLVGTAATAGAPFWVLVSRRDRGEAIMWMPQRLADLITAYQPMWLCGVPCVVRCQLRLRATGEVHDIVSINENVFFELPPDAFTAAISHS
jgi:hypothetical protein